MVGCRARIQLQWQRSLRSMACAHTCWWVLAAVTILKTLFVAYLRVEFGWLLSAVWMQVRGERPAVPAGHHLVSRMMGDVTYVIRSEYADGTAMFETHMARISGRLAANAQVRLLCLYGYLHYTQ